MPCWAGKPNGYSDWFLCTRDYTEGMKPEKQPLPETVDRQQFTDVMRRLVASPPLPKSAIARKRPTKRASPNQSQLKPKQ